MLPSMDEPTMDLDEDDFFSEEQSMDYGSPIMDSGGGDYDDELEWMQAKRKSMVTWWLLFFGALGGAGYFALDFLNQQDSKNQSAEVLVTDEPKDQPPEQAIPTEQEPSDSGEAEQGQPLEEGAPSDDVEDASQDAGVDEAVAVAEAEVPAAPQAASAPPAAVAPAAPPASPSPRREVDRGWSKIDREAWDAARTHFNNALRADPSNGDAAFGLAYVNENQGRVDEAVRQYCRLKGAGSGEAQAEAAGRLRALGRECP